MKDKILILCGEWNIDFLHENDNQKDLTDLLLKYNLVNTVRSPTRITTSTSTCEVPHPMVSVHNDGFMK
jgi:hypothetical protein